MANQTYLDTKYNQTRKSYTDDLTDQQWLLIEPLIPKTSGLGRKPTISKREVVNAIFYVCRNGISWSNLPNDFPSKTRVNQLFMRWRDDGTFEAINNVLNIELRARHQKEPTTSMLKIGRAHV